MPKETEIAQFGGTTSMDWRYFPDLFKGMFVLGHGLLGTVATYLSIGPLVLWAFPGLWGRKMKTRLKKIRKHLGVAFVVLFLGGVIFTSERIYTKKQVQFATPNELISSVLPSKIIRVVDLAMLDGVVRKRIFVDCDIYGPAILSARGENNIYDSFIQGDPEGSFIKTSNQTIIGAVIYEDCTFRNCRFYNVGFIGTPEWIEKLKSQITFVAPQTIGNAGDLNTVITTMMASQGRRLEKEYPLGYAVIGSAGDKRMILPRSPKFEVDWDNLSVQRNEKNIISIGFTQLREKEHNVTLKNLGLGMPAIPGLKSELARFWSVVVYGECLHVDSGGFVVALGFQEVISPEK